MNWAIKDKQYSQRRACALVGLQPKIYRYTSRRPDDFRSASACRNWLCSDGGSAIDDYTCCYGGRASC